MLLRKDDAWLEKLPVPDIRNWRVVDGNSMEIGFVETLVVDRQNNAIEAVLTGANDRFSASEIEIEDGVVRVTRVLRPRSDESDESDGSAPEFRKSYERHFSEVYDSSEWRLEDLLPAYRFGREAASDADFTGRSFEHAEEDLRAHYLSRRLQPPFHIARGAVERGYSLVHTTRPSTPGGRTL